MNRFASDIGMLDMALGYTAIDCVWGVLYFMNLMITVMLMNAWVIIPIFCELILFVKIAGYMKELVLETKRVDLLCKSPLF